MKARLNISIRRRITLRVIDNILFNNLLGCTSAELLHFLYHNSFENRIKLYTLDSLHRYFLLLDAIKQWLKIGPYKYLIVDKASQVSDSDILILLNILCYFSQPYEATRPRITLVHNQYQLPHNARVQHLPLYY